MNKLKEYAGLLNQAAPKNHFLAYITKDEKDMLVKAGGKETATQSGILAYPPGMGDPNYAGAEGVDAPAGGASAGGDYGGNVNPSQTYAGHTVQDQRDYRADPEGYVKKHAGDVQSEDTSWFDGIKSYIESGGAIGMAIELTGDVLSKIGEFSSELQAKAMTMSLNSRLKSIQKQKDFHPGAYGYKISDIQDDLEGIKDGTFTQKMYTAKYGSGDTNDPLDASYIYRPGGDNERGLTNIITPYAAHAIGGTTPVNSMAAQWYAGLGSGPSNPGAFNLTQEYAAAKAKVSQRLGNPTSVGQMAVSNSPFFNFLKDNSLDKGIL